MKRMRETARWVIESYKERGFLGFAKVASNYLVKEWRFSPYAKGIVLRKGKADQIRVLYVDTISDLQAKSNINGRIKAYSKVSTLMTFDYRKLARRYGQSKMNDMLLKTAIKFQPDLIQLGKSELIYGSTIKEIKDKINTCVIHFYGDFLWEIQPYIVDIGKYADCTLFYYKEASLIKQYKELGIKNIGFWLVGTDPDIFYPAKVKKTRDIVFMGNNITTLPHNDGYQTRGELIEAILKKGHDLHIYGNNWEYLPHLPNVNIHPFVDEEEFAKVCSRSKITMGISGVSNVHMANSWRRTFNSMASGAFHLTLYVPGMEEIFENKKHLAWFNSVPEAVELIEYYLVRDEERERIAEAGREEVLAHHTWDIRIAEMINIYQEQNKVTIPMKQ